ncbi:MAG TPA: aldo/keto reductase [Symbiobacteriaceae bacterium]|nr:aldo/keto reductase [Symbiobacteriaceae bacterium]
MQYRRLGRSGLKVSEIGLGTMMFGEKTDQAEATHIIAQALDAGVNLIDVADVYADGESERIVGGALQGRRAQAVLATKVGRPTPLGGGLSRRYIFQALEASLRRLGTEYIDLYQVHRFDPETPLDETLSALDDLVRQGKVRYIGCSNFAAWQLCKALWVSDIRHLSRFDSVQPRYNLVYREPEAELFPLCLSEGVGVLAYSPLAGGVLTGKYLGEIPAGSRAWQNPGWQEARLTPGALAAAERIRAAAARAGKPAGQVAIRWCLAHPAVSSALVGPRTREQWAEALAAADWSLAPAETAQLNA